MKRRSFVATAALGMSTLAGCTSVQGGDGGDPDGADDGNPTQTEPPSTTPEDTQEPTTETTEHPVADAVVESASLREPPQDQSSTLAATGRVANTGQVYLNAVSVVAKFYDADDQLLETGTVGVRALAPGESWEPWVQYRGDSQQVDSLELGVTQAAPFTRTVSPSGYSVANSTLEVPSESGSPRVTGTVKRTGGGESTAVLVFLKVYGDNGAVLGSGVQSLQQVASGETVEFDIGVHLWNPEWASRLTEHDVVLVE